MSPGKISGTELCVTVTQPTPAPRRCAGREAVLGQAGVAGVVEGVGEGPGEADALVELADGEQPGVAGELARRRLNDERCAEEVQDLGPGGGATHEWSPGILLCANRSEFWLMRQVGQGVNERRRWAEGRRGRMGEG